MLFHQSRPKFYSKPRYFKIKATYSNPNSLSPNDNNDLDLSFQNLRSPNIPNSHKYSSYQKFFQMDRTFPSNYVSTTKYTVITFLPKSLLLQFRRFANIYFLITAILQCFPTISPLNPFSAVSPFVFVIMLSLLREAIEYYDRYKSDLETNRTPCNVLCNGVPLIHQWHEIQVGNLLLIKDQEAFPADLMLLTSNHPMGVCYIETSSLDGEKGLKAKNALKETEIVKNTENLKEICEWEIECPVPDAMIHHFQGTIHIKKPSQLGNRLMLNQKQFLPRGARLKNSQWIIGVVIYTGFDTKVMRNSENSKIKQSKIEKKTNKYLLGILLFELICCITSAIGYVIWTSNNLDHWYIWNAEVIDSYIIEGILTFMTYFLLNNTMIPISLIVSLEFVKVAQAFFINQDEDLYAEPTKKSCKAMTSAINEELGQVEYIFSDKTGTLTCNKMQFKSLIIGPHIYGSHKSLFPDIYTSRSSMSFDTSKKNSVMQANHAKLVPPLMKSSLTIKRGSSINSAFRKKPNTPKAGGGIIDERSNLIYEFKDARLRKLIRGPIDSIEMEGFPVKFMDRSGGDTVFEILNQKELVYEMLQMMSTCHECIIEKQSENAYIHYQGQSPDEIALVDAARHLGFKFLGNSQQKVIIDILENNKELEMLHSFEFNSNRKRMSIIIKDKSVLKLYMKGADSKILEKLDKQAKQPFLKSIEDKIDVLSKIGMRVLCFAMKIISVEEYEEFLKKIKDIPSTKDREVEILNLAESLENNCIIIGATGVEDKLQEKVPETIHDLLSAKIRFWMLTGDKLETAENVGKCCQLIEPDMSVMRMSHTDLVECKKYMDECVDIYKLCIANNKKKALLIEGDALSIITSNQDLKEKFIHIAKNCEAVICCRVTPKQKADVVRLIKGHLNKVTLAIGDGANDINMIQEADIGIGIYGQEGLGAVQASDFAVGEFQCLWKLLLVHGRWCYIRIADMILYFFYKNMVMTLPQFFFSFTCGFSGQTIFDDWYITLYNMIFTCVPLLIRGILDQDVYYKKTMRITKDSRINGRIFPKSQSTFSHANEERTYIKKYYPKLYYIGQKNEIFNIRNFIFWIISAFIHSVFIFIACYEAFQYCSLNLIGYNPDLWSFSITAFTLVIVTVNIRLGLYNNNWTVLFVFSLFFLSFLLYFAYIFISDSFNEFLIYKSIIQTFQSFPFYACVMLLSGLLFALDLMTIVLKQEFSNSLINYFRILIKTGQEQDLQYYSELQKVEFKGILSKSQKSTKKIPRPSMFFEALEIKRMKEEFLRKKQFHFINIVNVKSGGISDFKDYSMEMPIDIEKKESLSDDEDNVIISEDVFIKRSSTIKNRNMVME